MVNPELPVAILGDGGWGTAIARVLTDNKRDVIMWGHEPEYLDEMSTQRENSRFLPGVLIPDTVCFEPNLSIALSRASLVVVAIPTQYLRLSLENAELPADIGVVSLTKGIEQETLLRPTEIIEELCSPAMIAALSGPSHAEEVAKRMPTTVAVASDSDSFATAVQQVLMTPAFRVYTSSDTLGVELGGAVKNVIAVAAGICIGLDLGDNALAALLTRGLAEMKRLGDAMGAAALTFAGLSGMGDLVVTCTSQHGRNRAVGIELGKGRKLAEIMADRETVAEGVTTAVSTRALAQKHRIEMPIVEQVYQILYEEKDPQVAVTDLMMREGKSE